MTLEDYIMIGSDFIKIFVIAIVLFFVTVFVSIKITDYFRNPMLKEISSMGYDVKDVRIFLRRIDGSLEDFISSKGLRLQYEAFSRGESTAFINKAEDLKKEKEATANGLMRGMVISTNLPNIKN